MPTNAPASVPAPRATARPPSLPAPLARLTGDGHRAGLTVGFIPSSWTPPAAIRPEEAAALPGLIAALEQALIPAEPRAIRLHLSRLAMNCRIEDLPERAWEMHLADFMADLAEVPEDIVAEACAVWRRTRKFWPTIAEFIEMTSWRLRNRRTELARLRVLARVAVNPAPQGMVTRAWLDGLGA